MITILGIKLSYETLAFLALFVASEVVGTSKLKENSIVQLVLSLVDLLKPGRREDELLERIKQSAREE